MSIDVCHWDNRYGGWTGDQEANVKGTTQMIMGSHYTKPGRGQSLVRGHMRTISTEGELGPSRKLIQADEDTEEEIPHGVKHTADEVLKP